MTRRRRARGAVVGLVAAALVVGACSNGDDKDGDAGAGGTGASITVRTFLTNVADTVVIPSYEALVVNLAALDTSLAATCSTPSPSTLAAAQASWRDADLAWESTRATDVGPANDRRLMSAVGFRARPDEIAALLAGTNPVDGGSLAGAGSGVRGLFAVEVALFGPGASDLTGTNGARRCAYARSATQLARVAAQQVLDDWRGSYRATFVAGMDGNPQSSVEGIVNELTFRLQEADDQGLRSFAETTSYDALPASRTEGPAAYGLASLRGILDGVTAAVVQAPDGPPGLAALVRRHDRTAGDRLEQLTTAASRALRPLPDSIRATMDERAALGRAQRAVSALRVYVSTTVASLLGVTIGFSDADGDS